jgi:hypothetical protein
MAEDTAQDVPTAPVVEDVDASTNDAQDTDVDLEDIEVNLDEGNDETEELESDDSQRSEPEDESEEDVEEQETEPQEESEEKPTNSDEERKRFNAEMAQKRIAEREARQQQLQENQQRYLQDAEDEKDLALRQLQIDSYNNKVDFNRNKLETGIDKALANIDLFKNGSPEQKEFLASSLDDFEKMYVTYDEAGNPFEVKGDVELFLQERAEAARRLAGVGARNQNKAKSEQRTRTMTPPSKAPKEPKVDSDLADFDSAWD